jgi:hypothetical protein
MDSLEFVDSVVFVSSSAGRTQTFLECLPPVSKSAAVKNHTAVIQNSSYLEAKRRKCTLVQ